MKLQPLLSEYLYTTGNLSLQNVGQLKLQQEPARLDAEATTLMAPASVIIFQQDENEKQDDRLIDFISYRLQTSTAQAQELLKQNDLTAVIEEAGGSLTWPTVGAFSKITNSSITFQPENTSQQYLPNIVLSQAQKAIEPTANSFFEQSESVTEVADSIETKSNLEELQIEAIVKSKWWIGALLIFILSLLLIAYRYL